MITQIIAFVLLFLEILHLYICVAQLCRNHILLSNNRFCVSNHLVDMDLELVTVISISTVVGGASEALKILGGLCRS